jgi:hypothetical protein
MEIHAPEHPVHTMKEFLTSLAGDPTTVTACPQRGDGRMVEDWRRLGSDDRDEMIRSTRALRILNADASKPGVRWTFPASTVPAEREGGWAFPRSVRSVPERRLGKLWSTDVDSDVPEQVTFTLVETTFPEG